MVGVMMDSVAAAETGDDHFDQKGRACASKWIMAQSTYYKCIASKAFWSAGRCAALDREPDGGLGTASIRLFTILLGSSDPKRREA